jgi:vitamin-K-epoxide reductase (warfarin-sensitive)
MEFITILGICGIIASLYAVYVEQQAKGKKKYVALCDINNNMSCSRVLTSEYAKLGRLFFGLKEDHILNVPNTYYGLLFYVGVTLYAFYPFTLIPFREYLLFSASVGSIAASCTLAYILAFILHDVCLVCVTTYILNILILWQAWYGL